MLFIEALAHTLLVLFAVGIGFAFGLARLDRVVGRVQASVAAQEARSLDDDLREL